MGIEYHKRKDIDAMNDDEEIENKGEKMCSILQREVNVLNKTESSKQFALPSYTEGEERGHYISAYKLAYKFLKGRDIAQIKMLTEYYCKELTKKEESSKKSDMILLSKVYGVNGIAKAFDIPHQDRDAIEIGGYTNSQMRKIIREICSKINDAITLIIRPDANQTVLPQFTKSSQPKEQVDNKSLFQDLLDDIEKKPSIPQTIPQVKRDVLQEQTDLIFQRFTDIHPEFYSVYSFVPIQGIPNTGIYDILKSEKNKNVIDAYIFQEIQRRSNNFGSIPEPQNYEDLFDREYLEDLKRRTNNYIKSIIKSYLVRDLVGQKDILKSFFTEKQAKECDEYRDLWVKQKEKEVIKAWQEMKSKYDADMEKWEENQSLLSSQQSGDDTLMIEDTTNKLKANLAAKVEEFEQSVYEESQDLTIGYLMILCQFLIALDEDHEIGKHAKVFRAKVLSGMYRINHLQDANQAFLYPEFFMNEKLVDEKLAAFEAYYSDKLNQEVQDTVVSYFYAQNATIQRRQEMRAMDFRNFDKYAVRPQEVCVNQPDALDVADGDLIVCKRDDKFYCYSRQQIEALLITNDDPIDPYTGQKFPPEMMERFRNQFGWDASE